VVVAVTAGVTAWTLFLLIACYPLVRRSALASARWILQSRRHLAGFVLVLFAVPIALIAV
jgi:hypothetical protein